MLNLMSAAGLPFLLFPLCLLLYYMVIRNLLGTARKITAAKPNGDPPHGISPAVARYIQTGGSDGTSLAVVLAQLAAKGVISVQRPGRCYRLELLQQETPVQPEEAALIQALFSHEMNEQPFASMGSSLYDEEGVSNELREAVRKLPLQQLASQGLAVAAELAAEPRKVALIDPRSAVQMKMAVSVIQQSFRKNLQGIYFHWNHSYVLLGTVATVAFAMGSSLVAPSRNVPPALVTLCLLLFATLAGLGIAASLPGERLRPSIRQGLVGISLPLLVLVVPGSLIAHFVFPFAQLFVLALLLAMSVNCTFLNLMRAPTARGRAVLEHLAGFREFLERLEQHRPVPMDTPDDKERALNRYLPYAIALEIEQGWGDGMAAAFANRKLRR